MRYIELFAGVGGFRNGLEACNIESTYISKESKQEERTPGGKRAADERGVLLRSGDKPPFRCVYANEWGVEAQREFWIAEGKDPTKFTPSYAQRIYRRHYGEIDTRDIRKIPTNEIPDHDLLTAGFPCQAFSVAGKGLGFEDTRGTLFFEIARILRDKRPRHLLLENVKGLVGHKSGETFQTILKILSDLGYRVEWLVLNSKHFGVPQNRERIFIVGHLRGECTGEIFPIIGTNSNSLRYVTGGGWGGKTGLYAIEIKGGELKKRNISTCLDANYYKGLGSHQVRTGAMIIQKPHGYNKGGVLKMPRLRSSSFEHNDFLLGGTRIRRLTPIECERLQGFPDEFTEFGMLEDGTTVKISDTQRYKCCGNAVTTKPITAIGEGLLRHENNCNS